MSKSEIKDRRYILLTDVFPISYTIASRDTHRRSLLFFDEAKNQNRALRYAVNQKSPFVDEQDDKAIIEPVTFEDGLLYVPKTNPVLQKFLEVHPDNGVIFEELDTKKDAVRELDMMNVEEDAIIAARQMDINLVESVARVLWGGKVDRLSSEELRRDIRIYARNYPVEFLDLVNDPDLKIRNIAVKAVQDGLFVYKNNRRDIFFNINENKKKMCGVPLNEDPIDLICAYLKTDEGLELYKLLNNKN
jgi:hypothetical protein